MPTTRKKVIKTVYKDEDDSEAENNAGDFSDSGSDAKISEQSSSEDEDVEPGVSSGEDFDDRRASKTKRPLKTNSVKKKKPFAKTFISKINKQSIGEEECLDVALPLLSVKDLTEADKLLPNMLNLSESDSSDEESSKLPAKKNVPTVNHLNSVTKSDSENETNEMEYKDVWSGNVQDNSEEIAKKAFMELEQHKAKVEAAKASILNYGTKEHNKESDVKDLLALGEEAVPEPSPVKKKGKKSKKMQDESDSDIEDWEEVKETKSIPQQGLQLLVEFPTTCKKSKTIDIEMMMKRKMNRVKKEHQVYMHKVHVLCWLGHGNYVSRILNDQEMLAATLSLVPSKECYPGERVDIKYVEQITVWYKDKLTLKPDKYEGKFRPKAPPLKEILLSQIKSRVITSKKYLVFIFVSMLRALGLQCRVMFNFVTVPLKPPTSELCSLSTKTKDDKNKNANKTNTDKKTEAKASSSKSKPKTMKKISQVDGNYDDCSSDELTDIIDFENIDQLDGTDDKKTEKAKSTRATRANKVNTKQDDEDVSPPKRIRKSVSPAQSNDKNKTVLESSSSPKPSASKTRSTKVVQTSKTTKDLNKKLTPVSKSKTVNENSSKVKDNHNNANLTTSKSISPRKTRSAMKPDTATVKAKSLESNKNDKILKNKLSIPKITVTEDKSATVSSEYFCKESTDGETKKPSLTRKRSHTANPKTSVKNSEASEKQKITKSRTRSAPGSAEKSKYFSESDQSMEVKKAKVTPRQSKKLFKEEDNQRVSHRDLIAKGKQKKNNDVTGDLVDIIKKRVKEAKSEFKKGIVKSKVKKESDDDSDFLPEEDLKRRNSASDDDFKPTKISPGPSKARMRRPADRRVLSSDEDTPKNKVDVWCEVYVEELEQWISVDVIKAKVHCTKEIYNQATHPVAYIVGWDNNNYLKDLTRRYVPQWNTVTRKLRAEAGWVEGALRAWRGVRTARDADEDDALDRLQLEAPLPTSIAEYKNHPLYALKRHLLKFEALYPPDAATLGFVRGEAVYSRACVHTCRSRDTWLKEAKVVRLGEQPYKVVKARPKWDRLSNKLITDKPLEVFGPWQVQDYEPPTAVDGMVPRNAYGNVELFKDCMLPKGTVHIKLPGLNKVAKKLNIDCAPAMTGFDFNGGWSHPVYDGFVVCSEFEQEIIEAWELEQEEQERRERDKIETRVYGNWKRLIKGLLIRERLKHKYGFEKPAPTAPKAKGPRVVAKKR